MAGLEELNWYLQPKDIDHPFGRGKQAPNIYFVQSERQFYRMEADEPSSFYHCDQEMKTWGFDSDGEPTKVGQVIDCLRIITHRFKTYAENYTPEEKLEITIKKYTPELPSVGQHTFKYQQQLAAAKFLTRMEFEREDDEGYFAEQEQEQDLDFLWWNK